MASKYDVDSVIEQRLLELAYTTDTKITAPALAYFARCSIEDAARVLEQLSAHDRIQMEFEDDGTVVYHVPARQRLAGPTPAPPPQLALAPIRVHSHREASPLLAAALGACVPGAGHLYAGRFIAAVWWFFVVSLGYILILPGLLFHLLSIVSAAASAHRLNVATARLPLAAAT